MNKWFLAALALVLSALQAWDSGATRAEWYIQGVIAVGVLLPGLAIAFVRSYGMRLTLVGLAVIVLATARVLSETHLPELMLAAVFPGILVLLDHFRTLQGGGPVPQAK